MGVQKVNAASRSCFCGGTKYFLQNPLERADAISVSTHVKTCPLRRECERCLSLCGWFLLVRSSAVSRLCLPVLNTVPRSSTSAENPHLPGPGGPESSESLGESRVAAVPCPQGDCELWKRSLISQLLCLTTPKPLWFMATNVYLLLTFCVKVVGWLWLRSRDF